MTTDTTPTTLSAWLLSCIEADEKVARKIVDGDPRWTFPDESALPWHCEEQSDHVAVAAARVLAECAAKRDLVARYEQAARLRQANAEKHAEASRGGLENQEQITALRTHGWELSGRMEAFEYTLRALASIYADRAGAERWVS